MVTVRFWDYVDKDSDCLLSLSFPHDVSIRAEEKIYVEFPRYDNDPIGKLEECNVMRVEKRFSLGAFICLDVYVFRVTQHNEKYRG